MSGICQVTGKKATTGHRVSHSNIKTNHWFKANIFKKRFYVPEENRFITLRVSRKGLRIIDKLGIAKVLEMIKLQGSEINN